jgi:hypothetical protein
MTLSNHFLSRSRCGLYLGCRAQKSASLLCQHPFPSFAICRVVVRNVFMFVQLLLLFFCHVLSFSFLCCAVVLTYFLLAISSTQIGALLELDSVQFPSPCYWVHSLPVIFCGAFVCVVFVCVCLLFKFFSFGSTCLIQCLCSFLRPATSDS